MREKINCIYKITNIITKDFYLGSTKDFYKRISVHKRNLLKRKHHSPILQRAYDKYGLENFTFEIFQYTSDDRLSIEDYYLKLYKPKYNISLSSSAPMEGRKHKLETKELFSKQRVGNKHTLGHKYSDERRLEIAKRQTGTRRSEETRKKMRETAIKLNRYKDLEKHIEKLRKKIIDSEGNTFKSLMDCANFWKISVQTVCDILKGRHNKTRKGIRFNYV